MRVAACLAALTFGSLAIGIPACFSAEDAQTKLVATLTDSAKELGYEESVAGEFASFLLSWKDMSGSVILESARKTLEDAKAHLDAGELNASGMAKIEEETVRNLYKTLPERIGLSNDLRFSDLSRIEKTRRGIPFCRELVFMLACRTVGLTAQMAQVLEPRVYSPEHEIGEFPLHRFALGQQEDCRQPWHEPFRFIPFRA